MDGVRVEEFDITGAAARKLLGVTNPTFYGWCRTGAFEVARVGKSLRFRRSEMADIARRLKIYDMTATDAASWLDVAPKTVLSWFRAGILDAWDFGGRIRYNGAEVKRLGNFQAELTTSDVAVILRVNRATVLNLGNRGKLRYSLLPGVKERRRYEPIDVEAVRRQYRQ
jgi:predicted site-specific integrase-resolvase